MSEYFENTRLSNHKGDPMRLPVQTITTNPQFHNALLNAKTMRSKLAACYHMLSQTGTFSDSGQEVWDLRQEVAEHLPEEMRSGDKEQKGGGKALR